MPQEEEEEALSEVPETAFLNTAYSLHSTRNTEFFTAVNTLSKCVCNLTVDLCLNAALFWSLVVTHSNDASYRKCTFSNVLLRMSWKLT